MPESNRQYKTFKPGVTAPELPQCPELLGAFYYQWSEPRKVPVSANELPSGEWSTQFFKGYDTARLRAIYELNRSLQA